MHNVRVIEVVETTLLTKREPGKDEDNPVRIVTQYWSKSGELLAEHDPCPDELVIIKRLQQRIDELLFKNKENP